MSTLAHAPDPPPYDYSTDSSSALGEVLGSYQLDDRTRLVALHRTPHGAGLILDTEADTRTDPRLVGRLDADEPGAAAAALALEYLARPPRARRCRYVQPTDWLDEHEAPPPSPMGEAILWDPEGGRHRLVHRSAGVAGWYAESSDGLDSHPMTMEYTVARVGAAAVCGATRRLLPSLAAWSRGHLERELAAMDGATREDDLDAILHSPGSGSFRIAELDGELRWIADPGSEPRTVRAACGAVATYEPVVGLTRLAIRRGEANTSRLQRELADVEALRTTLNRGIRERFLAMATCDPRITRSEIARRCDRCRPRDDRPDASWVARRLGLKPSSGESVPTPWIAPAVLSLLATQGLGIDPSEVELA